MIDAVARINSTHAGIKRTKPNLLQFEQAGVEAQLLTNDPRWNLFLQQLQAQINKAIKMRDSLIESSLSPNLVNSEDMLRNKNNLLIACTEITTLEAVIAIPRQIITSGDSAKELLAK